MQTEKAVLITSPSTGNISFSRKEVGFMKIKEVIEKTGLTDRAIRLYIDEGLTAPSIEESYSGRKKIEFSESDVERLKNVAILRKAGFSISDIKSIADDSETAKEIVENLIKQTEENIENETEIVKRLKSISFDEKVTMNAICESLSSSVDKKSVPKEDLHNSLWNKIEQNTYKTVGIIGLIITGAIYVLTPIYWICEYRHLKLTDSWLEGMVFLYSGWIAITVLSCLIMVLNRDKSVRRNRKGRRIISGIITVCMVIIGCFSAFPTLIGGLAPPAYSYTTDVDDYLKLDGWVERGYGEEIRNLFPEKIPSYALHSEDERYDDGVPFTTKYFYKHTYDLDQTINIVAEWMLLPDDYEKAKKEAIKKGNRTEQRGQWVCVHYPPDGEVNEWGFTNSDSYIFAYNDNSSKVRYIASNCSGGLDYDPYYLSLDW